MMGSWLRRTREEAVMDERGYVGEIVKVCEVL